MPLQLSQKRAQGYRGAEEQTIVNAVIVSCSLFFCFKKKVYGALHQLSNEDIYTYGIGRSTQTPNQTGESDTTEATTEATAGSSLGRRRRQRRVYCCLRITFAKVVSEAKSPF